MPPKQRWRAATIKGGSFAAVIRAYMASPKFDALARSTRVNYAYLLRLAERPETLGALSVDVIRPALVQGFLDGFADRPAQQKCAQTAIKAVERWALVRDLLLYPISTGTEAIGSLAAMSLGPSNKCSSRNDMPARTWRELSRWPPTPAAWLRSGQDALVGYRGCRGPTGYQRYTDENRSGDLGAVHARTHDCDWHLGTSADLHRVEGGRPALHPAATLRPMAP